MKNLLIIWDKELTSDEVKELYGKNLSGLETTA